MKKPIIAMTMGDAAGIGPELVVKVLSEKTAWAACYPLVVGDRSVMSDISRVMETKLRFRAIRELSEARFSPPDVDVVQPEGLSIDQVQWGRLDPAMGRAAALCLHRAFEMALAEEVDGVVSAPLNKEAFHLAGYDYVDELEYLAELTNSTEAYIAGVMGPVWTIAVTEHVPFRAIADLITKDRVLGCIGKLHDTLKRVGHSDPRIAVAALNVHAGEGGLFGREEIDVIRPAIQQAREEGVNAQGPVPADMVFVRALDGDFEGVVCMYHDHANTARKLQPKQEGATVFMGLPVVCGTTAHGTAFDIAGQGIADPASLEAALRHTILLSSKAERQ